MLWGVYRWLIGESRLWYGISGSIIVLARWFACTKETGLWSRINWRGIGATLVVVVGVERREISRRDIGRVSALKVDNFRRFRSVVV